MTEYVSTQDGQRLRYADYHRDGLLDIFIGLGVTLFGVAILCDLVYLAGVFPATLLPLWLVARKATLSRMGVTDIPADKKANLRVMLILALCVGILGLLFALGLVVFLTFDSLSPTIIDWVGNFFWILPGILLAGVLAVAGLTLGIGRLLTYAVLIPLFIVVGHLAGLSLAWTVLLSGGLMVLSGLVMLLRFLGESAV